MLVHIFLFRWTGEASPATIKQISTEITALKDCIPGIVSVEVGERLPSASDGYDFAGVMRFESQAAFDSYAGHPAHLALLKWLVPLIEATEFDFAL